VAEGGGEEQATGAHTGTHDVFVSYASQDAAVANAVVGALERNGMKCWIAPRDVTPGAFYADAIAHAIDAAQTVVLILSQSAAASPHILREIERASSKRHPVISLRIDRAPLPAGLEYFLNTSQWLDASDGEPARAFPTLLEAARTVLTGASAAGNASSTAPSLPQGSANRPSRRWPNRPVAIVLALIAVTIAGFAGVWFWLSPHRITTSTSSLVSASAPLVISENSIAVLPFTDMSETKDQEYFADGMAEEVLDMLAKLPGVRVIGRTSSFQFKGKNEDLRKIGNTLGAAYVVEGSVRQSGNRLRVTAQLIGTTDGSHLWSESYDEDVGDVLKVQNQIASGIVRALQVTVGADDLQSRRVLRSAEAYDLYQRGRHAMDRFDQTGFEAAAGYFQQAFDLDPSSIRAAGPSSSRRSPGSSTPATRRSPWASVTCSRR
jgi:TolB-like protein